MGNLQVPNILPQIGIGSPITVPHNHQSGGSTLHQLQVNLGDLADDELWQLMEVLCREVTVRELNSPLQRPTTNTLGKSSGKWGP